MQTIYLDIGNKTALPVLYAKQGDSARQFMAVLTNSGLPYYPANGSIFSVWYSGASGDGNYSAVGEQPAVTVDGYRATVTMTPQMLRNEGKGVMSLILHGADGEQIGLWNIDYVVESIPGAEKAVAEPYFEALLETANSAAKSAAEAKIAAASFSTDKTLSEENKAADAKEVGRSIKELDLSLSRQIAETRSSLVEEISVESARIDNLASLPDGSTSGDAELADLRVDYRGRTWESAGKAVRETAKELVGEIENLVPFVVLVSRDGTCNRTYEEVFEAIAGVNDVLAYLEYERTYLHLSVSDRQTGSISFSGSSYGKIYEFVMLEDGSTGYSAREYDTEKDIGRIEKDVQNINALSVQRVEVPEAELIAGKYVGVDGKERDNADWCCSDYIKLDKVAYDTNISIPTTLGSNTGIVFFGINKNVISYITKSVYGGEYTGNLITNIPQGAEYVRFSLEIGDIPNVDLVVCNAVSGVPKEIDQSMRQLSRTNATHLEWRIGGITYANGKNNDSLFNRIRTGFIPVTGYGCTVDFSGDGKFLVFEYSSNNENSNLIVRTKTDWKNTSYTVAEDECKYIRIAAMKNDDSAFNELSAIDFGKNFTVTQVFLTNRAVGKYVSPIKEDFHYDGAVEAYSEQNKLATIYAKWDELATNYPAIVRKTVLGEVGGKEIRSYRITPTCSVLNTMDVAGFSSEPLKILFISCVHGNEGTIALDDFTLFQNLVENHTPRVLWNNCVFEVIPVANPVGYDANSRLNGNGININRNFPVGWVYADKTEDPYNASGDAPGSEYETNLLMNFVKANPDAFLVINRHGTDPWGVDGKEGYAASVYQAEIDTAIASACSADTMLRDIYEDIEAISPNNCIFSVAHGNRFNGTFDRWFNSVGYHGYLLEYTHRTNTEPALIDNDDVRRVGITAIANLLCDSVLNNRNILGNNNKISSKFDV